MSKVLIVAYSYTGNSRAVAELLSSLHSWPMAEVEDATPRAGASGTWRCLLDSWLRRQPPIRYDGPDPAGYDVVVLVAPIWAYRLAGPMRTFVAQRAASLPRYAIVSLMGGQGAPNAVAEIGKLTGRAPLVAIAITAHESEAGLATSRLRELGDAVAAAVDGEAQRPRVWSAAAA